MPCVASTTTMASGVRGLRNEQIQNDHKRGLASQHRLPAHASQRDPARHPATIYRGESRRAGTVRPGSQRTNRRTTGSRARQPSPCAIRHESPHGALVVQRCRASRHRGQHSAQGCAAGTITTTTAMLGAGERYRHVPDYLPPCVADERDAWQCDGCGSITHLDTDHTQTATGEWLCKQCLAEYLAEQSAA